MLAKLLFYLLIFYPCLKILNVELQQTRSGFAASWNGFRVQSKGPSWPMLLWLARHNEMLGMFMASRFLSVICLPGPSWDARRMQALARWLLRVLASHEAGKFFWFGRVISFNIILGTDWQNKENWCGRETSTKRGRKASSNRSWSWWRT